MTDEPRDGIPPTELPDEFEVVSTDEPSMDDYPDTAARKLERDKKIVIRDGVRDSQAR